MKHRGFALIAAASIAAGAVLPAAAAPPPQEHLRGTIVSVTATSLTLKTATGPVTVVLGPKTGYAADTAGTIADIVPGKFLGIASTSGPGLNRALEVSVFADSMRGFGEGDYPWDGGSTHQQHSSMTNGTAAMSTGHSTMTNATAGTMSGTTEKKITVTYKGGSRTLLIPAGTPVLRVAPGTKANAVPGNAAFVIATKAPSPHALFVVVAERGMALPL